MSHKATSKLATWNGSALTPGAQFSSSTIVTQQQQNGALSQLTGPPGVPPPSFQQQQQQHSLGATPNHQNIGGPPYSAGDGTLNSATQANATVAAPQTPAQQILMSAADRWGLLGLLAMIKNADADQNLLSIGTDLGTMGLDMQNQGYADLALKY